MNIAYGEFKSALQSRIYTKLLTLAKVEYTDESCAIIQEAVYNVMTEWFEKYDLVETIVPLVWWKEWINNLVRCLPRYELYILFKYDSKLEWREK